MHNRSLIEIVREVADVMPEEHKSTFESLYTSVSYAAPEAQGMWYNRLLCIFNDIIPNPITKEWMVKPVSALTKLSEQEVREKYYKKTKE